MIFENIQVSRSLLKPKYFYLSPKVKKNVSKQAQPPPSPTSPSAALLCSSPRNFDSASGLTSVRSVPTNSRRPRCWDGFRLREDARRRRGGSKSGESRPPAAGRSGGRRMDGIGSWGRIRTAALGIATGAVYECAPQSHREAAATDGRRACSPFQWRLR